jgi:hypothetical protein
LPDTAGDCDFGSSPDVNLCGWTNVPISAFEWLPSNGKDSFWIGGPRKDSNGQNEQGEEGIIWHGINYCPLNFEKTAERWCSWSGLWDGPNHLAAGGSLKLMLRQLLLLFLTWSRL